MPELYNMGPESEKELVRRILSGEPQASDAFCTEFRRRLQATASALLGYQDPEAEDMVQETLVAGLKALPGFEFRSGLHTWLNHICVNLCLKALRRRQRMLVQEDTEIERLSDSTAGRARPPDEAARHLILRGLAGLGGPCKKILGLRYELELDYGTISRTMNIPLGTVMSRLSRCKAALKTALLKKRE
jgi:RNA polymerase sigma-70 factor (ECF subfamily)